MKILADYHHHALWQSYNLLFVDRFDADLYRPIGMEWFDEWYWSFERAYHGDAVARQYLAPWSDDVDCGDHWERPDRKNPGRTFRMVTLEQARAMDFDLVIASVPDNESGFHRFAQERGARYGIQVGNQWQAIRWDLASFGLVTSTGIDTPGSVPSVLYHQEFDLETFRYQAPDHFGPVRSFVNSFPETPEYPNFLASAQAIPEFRWEVYGAYGTAPLDGYAAGDIEATPDIAEAMRGAGVIWHAKHWSDGFGHVIHNTFALGRPVFGYARYYADKLAGPLWVEGVTSFDVEGRSHDDVRRELVRLRDDPDAYRAMCDASAARFRDVVDFDTEADQIARMLGIGVPA